MTVSARSFHWDRDFEQVRRFLAATCDGPYPFQNWIPSRFENRKFGPCGSQYRPEDDELVAIWESHGGHGSPRRKVFAVSILDAPATCWINILPGYRDYEREIVQHLERQRDMIETPVTGSASAYFPVPETDTERMSMLKELGYQDQGFTEYNRRRSPSMPIPRCELPEGYVVRNVTMPEDYAKYKAVQASVFGHCEAMTEGGLKTYTSASFYRADLDIVAVAPDSSFAAFCTVRLDPASRIAELEPVGTHPSHRGLGLGRAVICEGLRRLERYRPVSIHIDGAATTEAANRLYDSVGFITKTKVNLWRKSL